MKAIKTILFVLLATASFGQIKATDPNNWEKDLRLLHPEGVKEVVTIFSEHNGDTDYINVGEETFGYDEKGRLDYYIYVDYTNHYNSFELLYDYVDEESDKLSKRRLYYGNNENPTEIATYSYDDEYGDLTSIKQEVLNEKAPEEDRMVMIYTYSYDDQYRLSKISASGVDRLEINASIYEYNHRGDLISVVQTLAGDFVRRSNFKYDEKGMVSQSSMQEKEDGELLYKTNYTYDDEGNFISQSIEGRPDWEVIYEFDDKKNWTKSQSKVWDGAANNMIPYNKAIRTIVYR